MAWSLLNINMASDVEKLVAALDDSYPPGIDRGCGREQTLSIIHAALWAYASRAGSTASAYAFLNLMEALGVKAWSFDEADRKILSNARDARRKAIDPRNAA